MTNLTTGLGHVSIQEESRGDPPFLGPSARTPINSFLSTANFGLKVEPFYGTLMIA